MQLYLKPYYCCPVKDYLRILEEDFFTSYHVTNSWSTGAVTVAN